MPTVFREGPYRFFFYSNEWGEPVHIHVQRDDHLAKFWLDTVRLASSHGFSATELNKIYKIVVNNRELFMEAWNEYFNG